MNRRETIKLVLLSGATILGGTIGLQWYEQSKLIFKSQLKTQFLTEDDQLVLMALIPVFAEGIVPPPNLTIILNNIDSAIIRLPQRTHLELRELFDLLSSSFGKVLLAGVWANWQQADSAKLQVFLESWREHSLSLLQQAYNGLHQLVMGGIYAENFAWQQIGYAGPPKINFSVANDFADDTSGLFLK